MTIDKITSAINSKIPGRTNAGHDFLSSLKPTDPGRSKRLTILALAYLSALILAMIVMGPSLPLYALFALLAAFFILPDQHLLGLSLIITLTMFFERYFALQGLLVDKTVFKFYLLDIVICLSYTALIINNKIRHKSFNFTFGWPEKILVFWLILVAAYLARGYFDINADFATAFSSFKNYFFYPLLYFFALFAIDNSKKLKDTAHLILLSAVAIIAFIFIGLLNGQGLWTEFTPLSTAGTRYLAGTHAFYMALALALGLPLLLHKRLRNSYFAIGIMGFWAVGIALSLMRHLWLALAIGLIAVFIALKRDAKLDYIALASRTTVVLAALGMILVLLASLLYFQGSMDSLSHNFSALSSRLATVADISSDTSANWRQNVWYDAKKTWETNTVFGVGFGRVMLIDNGTYQNFEEIRNIHNSPLAITVQMGLIGLLAFALFILVSLASALKNLYADIDLMPYAMGLAAAISVFLAASLFQPYLETNLMAIWLWLLLGLLRAASLIRTPNYEDSSDQ